MKKIITKDENSILFEMAEKISVGKHSSPVTDFEIREVKGNYEAYTKHGTALFSCTYIGDSKRENCFNLNVYVDQPLTTGLKSRKLLASIGLNDSDIMAMAEFVEQKRREFKTAQNRV